MLKEQLYVLTLVGMIFFLVAYLFGDIFYIALGLRFATCYLFMELIYIYIFRRHKQSIQRFIDIPLPHEERRRKIVENFL
jgi:hypothetical protein